jgi:hypothetical protein
MKNIYLLLTLVGVILTSTISDASAQRTPSDTINDSEYCDQHLTINVAQPCAHQDTTAPYKVGDYYNVNGKQGVVFAVWDNGRHGKIVSLDETVLQWCTYKSKLGFANKSDGKANTDKVMSRADSRYFEAFVWCRNKGADWYLPAINELIVISINKSAINSTLAKYGTKLDKYNDGAYYWSSTEEEEYSPESEAWIVGMYRGYYYVSNKDNSYYVRAVSAF